MSALPAFKVKDEALARVDAAIAQRLARAPDGVVLVNGADIKPVPIHWLWRNWLALGKLHILAGAPGQGKTTIVLSFIAMITSGGKWPDGSPCTPGNVLVWSGEDDPADTLMPRLLAMGADVSRVYFVTAARVDGEVVPFDPARDLVQLTSEAERIGGIRLLMVDPVVSAVAGDSHKNTEVRRALQPLVDLGSRLNCAVLGISHFNKSSSGREPLDRVVGSVAFGAVARVVLVAAKAKAEGDEDCRVLARAKSNVGPEGGGFNYAIEQVDLRSHSGIVASCINWCGAVEGTARELLNDAEVEDDDEASALDDACAFLASELKLGAKPAKYLFAEARNAGHSERTLKRAKQKLRVESSKVGTVWQWSIGPLPVKDAKGANNSNEETVGTLGTLGPLEPLDDVSGDDSEVL